MEQTKRISLPLLLFCGTAAGFINGLLGAGGGVVLIFVLSAVLGQQADGRDIYANALAITLPVTLFSLRQYAAAGSLLTDGFWRLAIPAVLGGALGGYLLDRIDTAWTKRIFAAVIIVSGISMLLRK